MTRQDLRARYPLHNETMLAKGFIPPMPRNHKVRAAFASIGYWLTVTAALMAVGFAFGLVFIKWWGGA